MSIYDELPETAYGDVPDIAALRADAARHSAFDSRTCRCRRTDCDRSTRPPAAA